LTSITGIPGGPVVDADYKFIWVDTGANGSANMECLRVEGDN